MPAPVAESLVQRVENEEQDRQFRITRAWQSYYGDHPRPLKTGPNLPDDNVTVNLCRLVANKTTAFLFGKVLDWELEEGAETDEEAWLQRIWGRRRMASLKTYGLDGAVTGHPFFKLTVAGMMGGRPKPRVIVLDPATVRVFHEADDMDRVYRYRIQTAGVDERTLPPTAKGFRQTIDLNDTGQSWTIVDEVSKGNNAGWTEVGKEDWPYPFAPVVHNQNLMNPHELYGLADLERDTIRMNHGINSVVSNLNRIVRLWSHPRTFATGFTSNQPVNVDPNGVTYLGHPDSKVFTVEMARSLADAVSFLEELREMFHELTRVPEVTTGRLDKVGQLSGLAMQILYEPLVELTEDKRETYGEALEDLNKRLLVVGQWRKPEDEYDVTLHWPEIVPGDPMAEAQTALTWEQLGVSTDTILTRLGFNPDLEMEKKANEPQAVGSALLAGFNGGTSQVQPVPGQTPPPGQ